MKLIKFIFYLTLVLNISTNVDAEDQNFEKWKFEFKKKVLANNISESTFNEIILNTKYLPNVIKYDRYQPEFYEDTKTYISKRTSKKKVFSGLEIYKKNFVFINSIEKEFDVEKELLLSLMGIETNFGTYLGKMDIPSSLATLSFDTRRSDFFTKELIILLKLVDKGILNKETLYGSWAGALGFFQFMPSTIQNYALDYNLDKKINLKNNIDAFASAANYINKMGWKKNEPCFYKVELKENVPSKYLNTSAKKIINKNKIKFFKRYIKENPNLLSLDENTNVGIITPDKDIIPEAENLNPAYIVFDNYELILKWNRSLRFGLAVCTLKDKFSNAL
jgi:membrane-bound lytic murein transglycosylase B